ncbi:hypothetical protein ASPWEDRAFT_125450 [Aspergillus wentii DTO 134E9]|uniref:SH3 domain-containing protein n=1 Tax=Aspergillus wentii DTO 134E9 TaxID=1073089 RepID=A0A1L9S2Y5_ASPWE|nr:uncharacterized protein ASPWEDRAFT_125450 [Aspergillus wentii DTO 134E9]KAI9929870.1 hypothetical protein MW887_011678 [Aspergillus wentii]OJJ41521.1 hypothetical protein ASPWEDRAFT_125450 [Aspergillus wentii DTO 134E9]
MQRVQRRFGKLMKRSADESQVAVLLRDFEEANELLGRIIESASAWRDAWDSILTYQSQMVQKFEILYAPIIGASDDSGPPVVETPAETYARTCKLKDEYEEMRKDLMQELNAVEDRIIQPATQAKDYMAPMKKTIKKRDDRKVDFERYQSRFDNYQKKPKRSDRDNASLAKAEVELEKATQDYNAADDHLRRILPPLIEAVFSLFPRFLAAQVEIQNTMLANCYTAVTNFCQEEQFPLPAPPMEDIIEQWEFKAIPVQQDVETFGCIANSKSRQKSQDAGYQAGNNSSSLSVGRPSSQSSSYRRPSIQSNYSQSSHRPPSSHSGYRRPSSAYPSSQPPSPGRSRSPAPPVPVLSSKPQINQIPPPSANLTVPGAGSTFSSPQTPTASSPGESLASASRSDYFSRSRQPSVSSAVSQELSSVLATKKKPPPPPPSKPASLSPALFVTAMYDFPGEGAGDLAFREGDRIRVLKKTDSTDDWWEGQLRGVKGSFPANYVE